jgi:hypothetical protein
LWEKTSLDAYHYKILEESCNPFLVTSIYFYSQGWNSKSALTDFNWLLDQEEFKNSH